MFLGEIIVPLMFIFGILVRPAALIFSFAMLFAYLITEPGIIFTLTNVDAWGLENIAVYLFSGLAIARLGCGRYSVMSNPTWR